MANAIDNAINEGLSVPGAEDVTARYRGSDRQICFEGKTYLLPTVLHCHSLEHPLANEEFLFPYVSVVQVPQAKVLEHIGSSLVVTAVTRDNNFRHQLLSSPLFDRLNLGEVPTTRVSWDQPHEGNLFEFLYHRRAIQLASQPEIPEFPTEKPLEFDFHPLATHIVFGENSVDRIGEFVNRAGAQTVLVVTDPGIVAAGHLDRVRNILEGGKIRVETFDRVRENPSARDVRLCLDKAKESEIDLIIGLGGGSSLDTAKGCNFLLTNGGNIQDYRGFGKAVKPMLPFIAVPTTAGTGSECQSYALIADDETHQKIALGDRKAAAIITILDPKLTITQPSIVTACSGIDAIAHAVETMVTRSRNSASVMYSREAFKLTSASLPVVIEKPEDIVSRGDMMLGAAFAGIAIENSMLGAAHSAANPLTAHFDIPHGQAVGIVLPWIVRFNGGENLTMKRYAELAVYAGVVGREVSIELAFENLLHRLTRILNLTGLKRPLKSLGVQRSDIKPLAEEAAGQWTVQFNPREITQSDFEELYESILEFSPRGS